MQTGSLREGEPAVFYDPRSIRRPVVKAVFAVAGAFLLIQMSLLAWNLTD